MTRTKETGEFTHAQLKTMIGQGIIEVLIAEKGKLGGHNSGDKFAGQWVEVHGLYSKNDSRPVVAGDIPGGPGDHWVWKLAHIEDVRFKEIRGLQEGDKVKLKGLEFLRSDVHSFNIDHPDLEKFAGEVVTVRCFHEDYAKNNCFTIEEDVGGNGGARWWWKPYHIAEIISREISPRVEKSKPIQVLQEKGQPVTGNFPKMGDEVQIAEGCSGSKKALAGRWLRVISVDRMGDLPVNTGGHQWAFHEIMSFRTEEEKAPRPKFKENDVVSYLDKAKGRVEGIRPTPKDCPLCDSYIYLVKVSDRNIEAPESHFKHFIEDRPTFDDGNAVDWHTYVNSTRKLAHRAAADGEATPAWQKRLFNRFTSGKKPDIKGLVYLVENKNLCEKILEKLCYLSKKCPRIARAIQDNYKVGDGGIPWKIGSTGEDADLPF